MHRAMELYSAPCSAHTTNPMFLCCDRLLLMVCFSRSFLFVLTHFTTNEKERKKQRQERCSEIYFIWYVMVFVVACLHAACNIQQMYIITKMTHTQRVRVKQSVRERDTHTVVVVVVDRHSCFIIAASLHTAAKELLH